MRHLGPTQVTSPVTQRGDVAFALVAIGLLIFATYVICAQYTSSVAMSKMRRLLETPRLETPAHAAESTAAAKLSSEAVQAGVWVSDRDAGNAHIHTELRLRENGTFNDTTTVTYKDAQAIQEAAQGTYVQLGRLLVFTVLQGAQGLFQIGGRVPIRGIDDRHLILYASPDEQIAFSLGNIANE